MASRRITVTVESSLGEDGPLTVRDALGQVLDFFELMTVAGDHFAQGVGWALVSVSKNSPLTATAEAFSVDPGVSVDDVTKHIKYFVSDALNSITAGVPAPGWLSVTAQEKVRALLKRNLNGVGRTDIFFDEDEPPSVIVERTARTGLYGLDRARLDSAASEPDMSHSALGSAEGILEGLTTYYNKPAVRIREPISGRPIPVVLSDTLTKDVGRQRVWQEVWAGRRVRAIGRIFYKRDGTIGRLLADDLLSVEPEPMRDKDLLPALATNITPREFLDQIWSDNDE